MNDAPGRKFVVICDWLPPDFGAVGQTTLAEARALAATGAEVILIGLTSGSASESEEVHGTGHLRIVRLRARVYARERLVRRLAWTVATNLGLIRAAHRALGDAETILFTGSPPLLLHFVAPANLLWRRRLVYTIMDFHPECLMAEMSRPPAALRWFHRYTVWLRKRVDDIRVLGHDQRRRLIAMGMPPGRITIVPPALPVAVDPRAAPLARPAEIEGRVVLLYSGNYGLAHEVDTLVEGYRRHHREGSGRVGLWLNAVGRGADEVERRLRADRFPLARSHLVPLAELPRLLVTPDAHLITLKDAFWGYVLPSKVFGCLASGRDIVFVGSAESDVDALCRGAAGERLYRRVAVGDAEGLAAALEALADAAAARLPAVRVASG